jgi:AcrR family transcriptional regulator
MAYDSAATKARILEAATTEFASHGLAGARVDRIAALAGANKQLIYAYFGSKEALFDSVMASHIEELLDAVPFDTDNLPCYAQALVDFDETHPHLGHLARWHSLERPGLLWQLPYAGASMGRKAQALAEAQAAGTINDELPPDQLLGMLLALVHGGSLFEDGTADPAATAARRAALAVAVRRLVAPAAP